MRLAITLAFILGLLALLVFGPPAFDAFHDRQHRLIIGGPLSVYQTADERDRGSRNREIARVSEKDTLKILRIRYEKDYMVVRVKLPDGREGYIFSDANVQVLPDDTGR